MPQGTLAAAFNLPGVEKPPKLWRLLLYLAVAILAIVWLHRYAVMSGAH